MPQETIGNPKQHDRARSLGWIAVWFIHNFVRHGRGGVTGQPIHYGSEYIGFIVDCYALDENGRRLYDRAFFSRPKGCDKSGVAAALSMFEAFGPCRFDHWAKKGEYTEFLGKRYYYREGDPVGKQMVNPQIRIMATEEGQTGNVYDSIYYNLTHEECPLYQLRAYDGGIDVGKTRIILGRGGTIEPMSSGAASKDGGLETFAVFDETHLYSSPQLKNLYSTVSRNLRKRRPEGTWYIETTTMYQPGEQSTAEDTYEYARGIKAGRAKRARLLYDHRWADVTDEDMGNEEVLRRAFYEAYGECATWKDPEDFIDGVFDPQQSVSDTRRYFLNALVAANNAWLQPAEWEKVGRRWAKQEAAHQDLPFKWRPPMPGDTITLGFDGGQTGDATVLIACRVEDHYLFPIGIWESPQGREAKDYHIDTTMVDAVVAQTFKKYNVVGFFADPPFWQDYVAKWERDFGRGLKVSTNQNKSRITFNTNKDVYVIPAVERLHTAIVLGHVRHGNHPTFTKHMMNARIWKRRGGDAIGKERHGSSKKIDAAIGAVLAYEACARYEAVAQKTDSNFKPFNPRESGKKNATNRHRNER